MSVLDLTGCLLLFIIPPTIRVMIRVYSPYVVYLFKGTILKETVESICEIFFVVKFSELLGSISNNVCNDYENIIYVCQRQNKFLSENNLFV